MKVTVCFDNVRVVVPCGDGSLLIRDLMHEAILRYRKATGKTGAGPTISSLSSLTGGGLLDPDDRLCDVADDREQIVAHFSSPEATSHGGGDGASSVGTNSPDFFQIDTKEHRYRVDVPPNPSIHRESTKRLSIHALSAPHATLSLPSESRRREPLGQDAKASFDLKSEALTSDEAQEIIIKNDTGPLGLHVVPCYDLFGNDQGLRVEGIDPNGRIAKDGQIQLYDRIIMINGHNLLKMPFSKVQSVFKTCMSESCLKISLLKPRKSTQEKKSHDTSEKTDHEDSLKKLQCTNYNILQSANTRKIGKMIEIELTKGTNGLGFSVTTRDNPAGGHCPIYIKNILPKGAAVEDGRLRSGDRLLVVNNIEMTGKGQSEVVSMLRSIPPGGKVRMTVSRQEEISTNSSEVSNIRESSPDTAPAWSTPVESPEKPKNLEYPERIETNKAFYKEIMTLGDVVLSPRKNRMILTLDIPVHDSEKAGLGVSVKGKTSSADESSNMDLGIFIKSVLHGGAASRDGRLKTNDQLLNVNGVSLLGLSNSDAMDTLRRAMLNTNSSVTGVITLTVARKVSSYENQNFVDISSPSKVDPTRSSFIFDEKMDSGQVMLKNNLNNAADIFDNRNLLSNSSTSTWNPVIERLTEQYSKNSLRNESYCLATNKTWIESSGMMKKSNFTDDMVLFEEVSTGDGSSVTVKKPTVDEKDGLTPENVAYDSQLSLEESNASNKFSRDALGRQSISEKRHASLDAKQTDTYKRNKKIREGRDSKNSDSTRADDEDESKAAVESTEKSTVGEISRRSSEQKTKEREDYVYTIPGCNNHKFISPKKHWLVDDVPGDVHNQYKEAAGFSNIRGDVKQASLNSALDKRSRKKGLKSMLRLGKNRKSLNFGDNVESRHDSSNYCSGTINYIS